MQRNKFFLELFERVSLVADKNITKYTFYLKVNNDQRHLLEEQSKDKVIQMIH